MGPPLHHKSVNYTIAFLCNLIWPLRTKCWEHPYKNMVNVEKKSGIKLQRPLRMRYWCRTKGQCAFWKLLLLASDCGSKLLNMAMHYKCWSPKINTCFYIGAAGHMNQLPYVTFPSWSFLCQILHIAFVINNCSTNFWIL